MYYVYILKNLKTKNLYIGYTRNLRRRINEHQSGKVYTTKRLGRDVDLVYYEAYKNEDDARDREKSFKNSGSVYNGLVKRIKRSRGD
ncbi:MAG: GIY-YIG nuclease family protein [Candidatus Zambryskibacteria bacterium]|nr:GIY-YIG nuclease family protein [Candidatus Zambryskibacteria bacterium]